jgi:hypothetical protein
MASGMGREKLGWVHAASPTIRSQSAYEYRVVFTNAAGQVFSSSVTLTFNNVRVS